VNKNFAGGAMNVPELNGRESKKLFLRPSREAMESVRRREHTFYNARHFHRMLRMERKRAERSQKPFLLTLLDLSGLHTRLGNGYMNEKIQSVLVSCSRETDILGWYEDNRVMGVVFTEMTSVEEDAIERIFVKLHEGISKTINAGWIKISFQALPERNGDSAINYEIFSITLDPVHRIPNITSQVVSPARKLLDMARILLAFIRFSPLFSRTSRWQRNKCQKGFFIRGEKNGYERQDIYLSEIPVHVYE